MATIKPKKDAHNAKKNTPQNVQNRQNPQKKTPNKPKQDCAQDLVTRLSISLEPHLLAKLDSRIIAQGYSSRSELVRDMIRQKLVEESWQDESKDNIAVLVVVFNHHQRELNQRIIDIQHNASHSNAITILCTTHIHIDTHNCLESIMLKGKPSAVQNFALEIAGLKGVKFSKLTRTSRFDEED